MGFELTTPESDEDCDENEASSMTVYYKDDDDKNKRFNAENVHIFTVGLQ